MKLEIANRCLNLAVAVAFAVGAAACAGEMESESGTGQERTATLDGDPQAGHQGAPITLTGCLQRGNGVLTESFILTAVNSPAADAPIATRGESDKAAPVEREELRAAKHAYRLRGDDDELEQLVGRQIRVTGTLAELSDLPALGAAGSRDERRQQTDAPSPDIQTRDLAQVEVQSVEQIAAVCSSK